MDYKTFIHDFDTNKKELVNFINLRNKRNVERAEDMVNNYVNQMATGDYSIKSYKAKIIHNELDCNHAIRDVAGIKDKVVERLVKLIDDYFSEYLESNVDNDLPKTKTKEMRDFIQENRRQKHDVLLKKNNIDKDFNQKSKELESEKKEKLNSYNEKINSLKMRLVNDLKRQNEKVIKDYTEYELALLDNDDNKKIKELKEKIKEVRKAGLDEEYKIKMDSYDEILNEELSFTKSYQEFIYELEKYRREMQVKITELECENNILTIENDYQDKLYDINQDLKVNNRFGEEIKRYEALVKEHNSSVAIDYTDHEYTVSEQMFVYDLALLHVYELLVEVHLSDRYNPFGNFLINLVGLIENEKTTYANMLEGLMPLHDAESETLKKALKGFKGNPKKKLTRKELESNVIESLDRYFDNYKKEIDHYNMVYSDVLYNIVKELKECYEKVVNVSEKPVVLDDVTNYDYVDLTKYGYKKEREVIEVPTTEEGEQQEVKPIEVVLKENLEVVIKKYLDSFEEKEKALQESLQALNADRDEKVAVCNNDCKEKTRELDNEYTNIVEKNKKELLIKEKEVTKATSKSINKAKKLLQDSKKAL